MIQSTTTTTIIITIITREPTRTIEIPLHRHPIRPHRWDLDDLRPRRFLHNYEILNLHGSRDECHPLHRPRLHDFLRPLLLLPPTTSHLPLHNRRTSLNLTTTTTTTTFHLPHHCHHRRRRNGECPPLHNNNNHHLHQHIFRVEHG